MLLIIYDHKNWKQRLAYIFVYPHYQQHYSQQPKLKAIQVPIKKLMDKQKVANTHHRILFGLKKKENSNTWDSMYESWRHIKQNTLVTKRQIYCVPQFIWVTNFTEPESGQDLGQKGNKESLFKVNRFQFCKMNRVLWTDIGNRCTNLWMHLCLLNRTFKNG